MSEDKPRKAWGAGRVALVARLDTIRSEMGQGLPLTAIYDRHRAALGIGYQSFCKLIARYAGDAKLSPRYARPTARGRAGPPPPGLRRPRLPQVWRPIRDQFVPVL